MDATADEGSCRQTDRQAGSPPPSPHHSTASESKWLYMAPWRTKSTKSRHLLLMDLHVHNVRTYMDCIAKGGGHRTGERCPPSQEEVRCQVILGLPELACKRCEAAQGVLRSHQGGGIVVGVCCIAGGGGVGEAATKRH